VKRDEKMVTKRKRLYLKMAADQGVDEATIVDTEIIRISYVHMVKVGMLRGLRSRLLNSCEASCNPRFAGNYKAAEIYEKGLKHYPFKIRKREDARWGALLRV